jgi:NAD(P)-dependent dehydrogenase (short-subunit alcohol dehydrogenase family)
MRAIGEHRNMKPVVFITGASSGIGYELALELAARGYDLALASRRKELLDDLSNATQNRGAISLALACDVGDQQRVKQAVAETLAHFGRIDLAILSAGISGRTDAANFSASGFERMLRTNLLGVAYCLEELIPIMLEQGAGTIAAISSLAGDRGMPGASGYCATKAALSTLLEGMRVELRNRGISIVTIEPGYVLTPMTEDVGRMPFLMQADESARLILNRIERGDRVIRFPFIPSAAMKLVRMLPVSIFDAIAAKRRPVRTDASNRFE